MSSPLFSSNEATVKSAFWAAARELSYASAGRATAYSKLTLSLRVLGTREDGYHELEALTLSIGQRDGVFLPGRFQLLPGRLAFDLGQHDIGGRDLVGLLLSSQRPEQPLIEIDQVLNDPALLPAVKRGLMRPVRPHQGRHLGLQNAPLGLAICGFGNRRAVLATASKLDRLAQ